MVHLPTRPLQPPENDVDHQREKETHSDERNDEAEMAGVRFLVGHLFDRQVEADPGVFRHRGHGTENHEHDLEERTCL